MLNIERGRSNEEKVESTCMNIKCVKMGKSLKVHKLKVNTSMKKMLVKSNLTFFNVGIQ